MKSLLKIFVLIAFATLLISCGASGWSCQKRYVYVPINKEYIKKHQSGADSFDKLMLNKKVNPKI